MNFRNSFILGFILIFLNSCSVLKENPNSEVASNIYKSKIFSKNAQKIYLQNEADTIVIYKLQKDENNILIIDTLQIKGVNFPQKGTIKIPSSTLIYKNSIDIDFLTIPFKYRPSQTDLPRQFTTNLNGAIYLGQRTDFYKLKYKPNPFKKFERNIAHYAFSFGVFTGLGSTAMNPSVTQENITKEYDGVVWSKGIAGIIGINNFTVGLAFGFDDLLDGNKKHWIYQGRPWYGMAFGLNLN